MAQNKFFGNARPYRIRGPAEFLYFLFFFSGDQLVTRTASKSRMLISVDSEWLLLKADLCGSESLKADLCGSLFFRRLPYGLAVALRANLCGSLRRCRRRCRRCRRRRFFLPPSVRPTVPTRATRAPPSVRPTVRSEAHPSVRRPSVVRPSAAPSDRPSVRHPSVRSRS